MLVRKNPSQHCPWFHNISKKQFPIKPDMFSHGSQERLAWFGHVHCMPDDRMAKRVYVWSPALTRSLGRPKNRWEDDVKSDVANLRITNWKDCVKPVQMERIR